MNEWLKLIKFEQIKSKGGNIPSQAKIKLKVELN